MKDHTWRELDTNTLIGELNSFERWNLSPWTTR